MAESYVMILKRTHTYVITTLELVNTRIVPICGGLLGIVPPQGCEAILIEILQLKRSATGPHFARCFLEKYTSYYSSLWHTCRFLRSTMNNIFNVGMTALIMAMIVVSQNYEGQPIFRTDILVHYSTTRQSFVNKCSIGTHLPRKNNK